MAFNFLGTFNKAQFDRLVGFARAQVDTLDRRIQHLNAELTRVGRVRFTYDSETQEPTSYTADKESYIGKLIAAYEVLGGNPFIDLRTRDADQAIFIRKGTESVSGRMLSNGEVLPGKALSDGRSADLVRRIKEWNESVVARRYERLERMIRRALDYADQLEAEIALLNVVRSSPTRGFEKLVEDVNLLIQDPNYRAITPDTDPLGLLVHAPYSSYDLAQTATDSGQPIDPNKTTEREAVMPQRQNGVIVRPGQRST